MTRKLKLACASAAIAGMLLVPAAEASVVQSDAVSTVDDPAAYWTDKRMANAKPVEVVIPGAPTALEESAAAPETRAGPIPYTSYELPDPTAFPERVHGKVFFTKPNGQNYVCSGTVVNGTNDSTVITAGHCVFGAGAFWTNWIFVPGYRRGSGGGDAPYGTWNATSLFAPSQWTGAAFSVDPPNPNYKYDFGAAVVDRNSSGLELEDLVGARGIAFNQSTNQHFISHGYPAGSPFDGFKLWVCESDFGGFDLSLLGAGPPTMAIGCNMTGGSSGGGWVIEDASGNGFVNSVNSYKYGAEPEVMFGPYFDSTTQAIFNAAQNQAPGQPQSTPAALPPSAQPAGPVKVKCKKKRRGTKKRCRKILTR
jgi:V8-like Glu-specific endopeptidase